MYSEIGLAGGACGGLGLLLDISDPTKPVRIDEVADANMSFWHSATFNNDGTKLLFTDEWGGGGQPRCRATDKLEWGSNALFSIENKKLKFHSYYKLPAAQSSLENCVAHNGSLIPIPGRDIMVQSWYPGGLSVFDWTDIDHPKEIAYFDRGPVDAGRMMMGGSWSAYWYNGVIVSSEIARGLDIYELVPNALISENELAAAKTVRLPYLEHPGSADAEVAADVRARARLPRSAGAEQRPAGGSDFIGARDAGCGRATLGARPPDAAHAAGLAAERRCRIVERPGEGEDARIDGDRPGRRALERRSAPRPAS